MSNDAQLDATSVIAAWCRADLSEAMIPADREFIEDSMSVRALIVELVGIDGARDELYDACAVMGRLLAEHNASPTLASSTIDHAANALGARGAPWVGPGRAALTEGFAATVVDRAAREAMQHWEFPSCAVPLGQGLLAIAAGHPSQDDEVLAAWSARVAREAAMRGVRQAVVAGNERARAAVAEALALVGIEVARTQHDYAGSRT